MGADASVKSILTPESLFVKQFFRKHPMAGAVLHHETAPIAKMSCSKVRLMRYASSLAVMPTE
jgi:hypothetical protein